MAPVRRKYQVFVSSTFSDLSKEREEVFWQILKYRQIPVGMEAFPSAHDRGWETITRTIDDSDYYVLVLAGRYGSIDKVSGKSWTHLEYEYALSKGLSVLAFVRSYNHVTGDKVDPDRTNIDALRTIVRDTHHAPEWSDATDLASKVAHSLWEQISKDEGTAKERVGWIRGSEAASGAVTAELARLSAENATLRAQAAALGDRATKLSVDIDVQDPSYSVDADISRPFYVVVPSSEEQPREVPVSRRPVIGRALQKTERESKLSEARRLVEHTNGTVSVRIAVRADGLRAALDCLVRLKVQSATKIKARLGDPWDDDTDSAEEFQEFSCRLPPIVPGTTERTATVVLSFESAVPTDVECHLSCSVVSADGGSATCNRRIRIVHQSPPVEISVAQALLLRS